MKRLFDKRNPWLRVIVVGAIIGVLGVSAWPKPQNQAAGQADKSVLAFTGDIPAPVNMKAEDLDKLPQEEATVEEEDGTTSKYTGVPLRAVLEKVGAPMGRALRGKGLASYILAKARDGYEVAFTPGELDTSFGNERVLLIYKHDGKPLFDYQGPFRILCPNDKAGARSLRMLASIEIVKLRK